jgi:hypothetical protein
VKSASWLAEHETDDIGADQLVPVADVDQADELVDEAKARRAACRLRWGSCSVVGQSA